MMINSVTGVPYPLPIGPVASSGVNVGGKPLVRMLDQIPTPPGIMSTVTADAVLFVIVEEYAKSSA